MRVCYLLEGTELFGGVKVVLRQASLVSAAGHEVVVAAKGPPPDWLEIGCRFEQVDVFEPGTVPAADVTVATYWTTLRPALASAAGEVVHYCQGFEASYTHNVAEHPAILSAYAEPVPAMCVAPHLAGLLERRFGRPARVVVQPLEQHWKPSDRRFWRDTGRRPRVLVVGPHQIDWKGVATSLEAVRRLRAGGLDVELVRLSQWPLTDEERRLVEPDEFHCHVPPRRAADIVAGCDLALSASWEQEGFGLPVLEAMASGVPVAASDIAAYRDFAAEAAVLCEPRSAAAFADAAATLLSDEREWRARRERGLAVAAGFDRKTATASAVDALSWVADGAWRRSLADGER